MAVKERRIGKPYVWNAWAYVTPPHVLERPSHYYPLNPFIEAFDRPERIARWEDDGGLTGEPERRGIIDVLRPVAVGATP